MASLGIDPALLAQLPSLQPPEGVTPNFIDPQSRAIETRVVICVALPLMLSFVALRLWVRLRTRQFSADDFLCIVAAAAVITWSGIVLSILGNPLGPHQWDVPLIKITEKFLRVEITGICIFAIASIFVKITLLVLYLRLFHPSKGTVVMIWLGIGVITSFYLATMIADVVLCTPHKGDGGYLSVKAQTRCGQPSLKLSSVQGVFGAISDVYIIIIPIQLVWQMRLPTGRKIGVSAVFLTGLLACACSILSCIYRFDEMNNPDFTWGSISVYSLSCAELNAGIICSCMPVVFVLFKECSKKFFSMPSLRYLRSRRRSTEESPRIVEKGSPKSSITKDQPKASKLPSFPRPIMTGLRTFISGGKGNGVDSADTNRVESFTEIESISDDYHEQLKAPAARQSRSSGS